MTHHVQRLDVPMAGCRVASELHLLAGANLPLVCFIPGGAIDPRRGRPITSRWETQQLAALAAVPSNGLTFNFPGVGHSDGELADNTLNQRTRWVRTVLHDATAKGATGPLVLVGCSMGAHTAAILTDALPVAALVLVAPAAYGRHTLDAPFGPAFTAAIRAPGSWRDSPAFAAAARYQGRRLLLLPEHDDVIPTGVTSAYTRAITPPGHRLQLPGASHHMLSSDRPEDHLARHTVCQTIAGLVSELNGHHDPTPRWRRINRGCR